MLDMCPSVRNEYWKGFVNQIAINKIKIFLYGLDLII